MPETMSKEEGFCYACWSAEIVLTPGPKGMGGAIGKASQLIEEHGDKAFMPQQFNNPANPEVHRKTTAEKFGPQPKARSTAWSLVLEPVEP